MDKKILMIGWEFPPFNSGGLGVVTYYLAKNLNNKINLILALPKKYPINSDLKLIFADDEIKILKCYTKINGIFVNGFLEDVLTYGIRLLNKIKELNLDFDIIHAHDWLGGVCGLYLKNNFKKPLIIHIHSTEIERTGNNPNPIIYQIEKEIMENSDKIISVSKLTKSIISNFYKIPEEKIIDLPNAIDLDSYEAIDSEYFKKLKSKNYKIVLFVGRLVLQKGPDYFVKTLKYVNEYIKKIKYVVVGDGEMLPDLIKIANEENVLDKIIFTGFLRDERLWGVYKYADLLVAPSVFDPFGLVPLEAVKFNIPIIISRTTGLGDYFYNCLKVDFWDIKKISNYIISILKYRPLKEELIKNAKKELVNFNWEDRANRLINIYENI
ncbi:MAG: glycosyltransferase family 4 protein [Minisyncoccia bacterium]